MIPAQAGKPFLAAQRPYSDSLHAPPVRGQSISQAARANHMRVWVSVYSHIAIPALATASKIRSGRLPYRNRGSFRPHRLCLRGCHQSTMSIEAAGGTSGCLNGIDSPIRANQERQAKKMRTSCGCAPSLQRRNRGETIKPSLQRLDGSHYAEPPWYGQPSCSIIFKKCRKINNHKLIKSIYVLFNQ